MLPATQAGWPALLALLSCSRLTGTTPTDPFLNEIASSNGSTVADEDGAFEDWIEIHNPGAEPVDLAGWGLSDDVATPFEWVFPSPTVVDAGGHLLVWASGKNRAVSGSPLHTNFAVAAGGETLLLTGPGGLAADAVVLPAVPRDTSYGRKPGAGEDWFYFEQPTPGTENTTPGFEQPALPPVFSHPAGFHTAGFDLALTAAPGWAVCYTLDGSEPDPGRVGAGALPYRASHLFEQPIPVASRAGEPNVFAEIPTTAIVPSWLPEWQPPAGEVFKATVVRAAAHDPATGRLSKAVTGTFFVDPGMPARYGSLPVISVVSDYVHLFDDATGIYVPGTTHGGVLARQNFFQGWARPASVEFFEAGGIPAFSGTFEISIQGATSGASMQKGLHVIGRADQGTDAARHPLFAPTDFRANRLAEFKRFILRAWGSARNWPVFFADAYHQSLAATTDLELQAYRPAVVFINGEYWGLHAIREANKNSWYHEAHTGIDRDDPGYDLIEGGAAEVDEGDAVHWNETMAYIATHDLADDAAYDHVATRIDVGNFTDYVIHCVFTGKRDWPDQNEAKWRPRTADGKWRWAQFDMDHGLSDWGKPQYDLLAQTLDGSAQGYGPHPLLVELIKNQRFRKLFINTYADWLNTRFNTTVALARFDAMKVELDPHIAEFDHRWPNTHDWAAGTAYGRDLVAQRTALRFTQLRNRFSLGQFRHVSLQADAAKGLIQCNSIAIDENTPGVAGNPYPWDGDYFQNLPIDLTALPRPGHYFAGWKVLVDGAQLPPLGNDPTVYSRAATITLPLTGTTAVEALFEPRPAPLADRTIVAAAPPADVDLAGHFVDFGDAPVSWQVASSSAVVSVAVNGSTMQLAADSAGEAEVTVTASSPGYAPLSETFRVLAHPEPFPAASGEFRFDAWSPGEPAGAYPAHMLFLQSEVSDPTRATPLNRAYAIPPADAAVPADADFPYAATSRTRINGLGAQGISFINTGRGRDLGSALLALDTTGQSGLSLGWTAGTVVPNNRIYALSLQYRLDPEAEWTDFPPVGPPVDYLRSPEPGHQQAFGPVPLPAALEDRPYVQLQWRYHHLSGTSGPRPEIRLDDIVLAKTRTYHTWVAEMFTAAEAADPAVSGPMAEYLHDGSPNLLKYALGLPPSATVGADSLQMGITADRRLFARFRLDRWLGDISYRLQASPDLLDWSEVVFDSRLVPGPNSHGEMHEVVLPHDPRPRKFLRLTVVKEF